MTEPSVSTVSTVRLGPGGEARDVEDQVAVEEPLEIRIEHAGTNRSIAVTMRTPGQDEALAAGFLFTEGVIDGPRDLIEVRRCREEGPDGEVVGNVVQALLAPEARFDPATLTRHVFTSSSCGVCGKATLDALEVRCAPVPAGRVLSHRLVASLPERLRAAQSGFEATGGIHATGILDVEADAWLVAEDVGRHNAMDKVIGTAMLAGRVPLSDHVGIVSGRLSFELVQKAARGGLPVLCAIGAPSSLAIETAERFGMTLVGFLRPGRANVYTHPHRVQV